MNKLACFAALLPALCLSTAFAEEDPYLWLEEVQDEKALDWVREKNASTFEELREGQTVEYEEGQGPKGPRAESVKVI